MSRKGNELRSYAMSAALVCAGCFVTGVVFLFGVFTFLTGAEVIPAPSVGPVFGPLMVIISTLAVVVCLVLWPRRARIRQRSPFVSVMTVTTVAAYAGFVIIGPAAYGFVTGDMRYFDLAVRMLGSPYSIVIALVACAVAFVHVFLVMRRARGGTRPLWPWEGQSR